MSGDSLVMKRWGRSISRFVHVTERHQHGLDSCIKREFTVYRHIIMHFWLLVCAKIENKKRVWRSCGCTETHTHTENKHLCVPTLLRVETHQSISQWWKNLDVTPPASAERFTVSGWYRLTQTRRNYPDFYQHTSTVLLLLFNYVCAGFFVCVYVTWFLLDITQQTEWHNSRPVAEFDLTEERVLKNTWIFQLCYVL